jgi:hypothetical protein
MSRVLPIRGQTRADLRANLGGIRPAEPETPASANHPPQTRSLRLGYQQLAVRLDPHFAVAAFSRCYRANPGIDAILNQALPAEPGVYVDVLGEAARSKQLAVAKTVWDRLLLMHPRLHFQDFDSYVSELLAAGRATDARRVWDEGVATMTLPSLGQVKDSVVWDPSFESGAEGYFFSWRYQTLTQGLQISLDPTQKHSGSQSLRLTFDGKHNLNLEAACTTVNVEPSTSYHFSGWIRTRNSPRIVVSAFVFTPLGTLLPPSIRQVKSMAHLLGQASICPGRLD